MGILSLVLDRLNIVAAFRELASSRQRVDTLLALAASQLLVQLTFLPVTLTIPSVADYFNSDVDDASWTVIIRLLALGSTVFLTAQAGRKIQPRSGIFCGHLPAYPFQPAGRHRPEP